MYSRRTVSEEQALWCEDCQKAAPVFVVITTPAVRFWACPQCHQELFVVDAKHPERRPLSRRPSG